MTYRPSLRGFAAVRLLMIAALVSCGMGAARPVAAQCPTARLPAPVLTHSRSVVAAGKEWVIVALGSSSTEGVMSSSAADTYPAQLQQMLSRLLPQAHVAVINRGIGGQDVVEESARLGEDVLAIHPQLVIWQVGANGALENMPPEEFRRRVTLGVHQLQLAGADVILMDNQRSPRLLSRPDPDVLNRVLAKVAADLDVGLFSRAHLMDAWRDSGAPYARFIASDGMHQNDLGYQCVAGALAGVMFQAVGGNRQVAGSAGAKSLIAP